MKIIGITGRARTGKDTLANFLVEDHGFLKLSFAAPIRAFASDITGIPVAELENGPAKEAPLEWLGGVSPRYIMQTVGTEWGRDMIDRDLWVKVVEQKIRQARRSGAAGVVISDVRFDNEAEFIRQWGGRVVELARPGTAAVAAHSSEDGIETDLIDAWFVNSGAMSELRMYAASLA